MKHLRRCKANPDRKHIVGGLKLSGKVERHFPANVRQRLAEGPQSRWKFPPWVANAPPPLLLHGFRAGAAEVHFVYFFGSEKLRLSSRSCRRLLRVPLSY